MKWRTNQELERFMREANERFRTGVAAYVRVSSRSQDEGMQVDTIRRAAAAAGHEIEEWFTEKRTGKTLERPELARLRELARLGYVRTLYVFRIDRLTRSGIRDTLTLLEEFRDVGCRVVSLADGVSLDEGPARDVVIAVMAWVAQMEREALDERIAAARARKEAKGERWGRPQRLCRAEVGAIRARAADGQTVRQISVALKVPKSTVGRVLSNKSPYNLVADVADLPLATSRHTPQVQ